MICERCGKYNTDNSKRCLYCGEVLDSQKTGPLSGEKSGPYSRLMSGEAIDTAKQKLARRRRSTGGIASVVVPIAAVFVAFACAIGITFYLSDGAGKTDEAQTTSASSSSEADSDEDSKKSNSSTNKGMTSGGTATTSSTQSGSGSSGKSSGAVSDTEAYEILKNSHSEAATYNTKLIDAATEFNKYYVNESAQLRKRMSNSSSNLTSSIRSDWNTLKNLNMPFWSGNYEAWEDLCEIYEGLYKRSDVISQAWALSVSYDDPEEHTTEICKPLEAQKGKDGVDIYYTRYKELYPTITIEKP